MGPCIRQYALRPSSSLFLKASLGITGGLIFFPFLLYVEENEDKNLYGECAKNTQKRNSEDKKIPPAENPQAAGANVLMDYGGACDPSGFLKVNGYAKV